jgi:hypothetical protein
VAYDPFTANLLPIPTPPLNTDAAAYLDATAQYIAGIGAPDLTSIPLQPTPEMQEQLREANLAEFEKLAADIRQDRADRARFARIAKHHIDAGLWDIRRNRYHVCYDLDVTTLADSYREWEENNSDPNTPLQGDLRATMREIAFLAMPAGMMQRSGLGLGSSPSMPVAADGSIALEIWPTAVVHKEGAPIPVPVTRGHVAHRGAHTEVSLGALLHLILHDVEWTDHPASRRSPGSHSPPEQQFITPQILFTRMMNGTISEEQAREAYMARMEEVSEALTSARTRMLHDQRRAQLAGISAHQIASQAQHTHQPATLPAHAAEAPSSSPAPRAGRWKGLAGDIMKGFLGKDIP